MILSLIMNRYFLIFILTIIYSNKQIRYLILSFFVEWLNEHEKIGKLLGIKYSNDYELNFNRNESRIYTPGMFKILVEWFVGVNIKLEHSLYKSLLRKQFELSRKVKLNEYLEKIKNKKMSLDEFEDFLSVSFLLEVKSELNNLNDADFNKLMIHNKLVRNILNSLTGETNNLFNKIIFNLYDILDLRRILFLLPPETRLFAIVPQFTILNKFVEMIISKKGKLEDLEFYEFVIPGSFLTIMNKNELYIVRRHIDKTNGYSNIGFGVKGFQCPASKFVFNVINKTINHLKKINITIEGTPIYIKSKRFPKNIINKKDIYLTFNYNE